MYYKVFAAAIVTVCLGIAVAFWFKATYAPIQTLREIANDFVPKDERFFDPHGSVGR